MKKNNIIKYLWVSLFVFFGCLFSFNFSSAENITSSSDWNDWEWLKLATNETWNFTIENVIRDNLNRFTVVNLWNWNWTWIDNWYTYTNIFKMIMTNWPVPSYFWYWNTNSEIVFASSYFNRWVSPLYVCKTDNPNFTDYVKDNSCYTTNISELYSENWSIEYLTFWQETRSNLNIYNNNYLCFSFDNWNTYCVKCLTNWATCQWGETLLYTNNWDFSIWDYQELAWVSPFLWGGWGDIPDIIWSWSTVLTNSAVALGLSYRYWYWVEDCYWGYPLNDIFTADLDPANFTWYLYWSGASIYDIFNAYSWSYFTDINTFYNSFYSRYSIWNISSFWDYPKWLYSISQRAWFLWSIYDLYPVNMANLVEFCDLRLKSDLDALYTWDNYIWIEWYYSLIGEVYDKRRYYDTNLFSWSDSTWSMSIDEFFTSVSNRLVAWLEDISDNRTWIIPSYILMVMMALILFRLISH